MLVDLKNLKKKEVHFISYLLLFKQFEVLHIKANAPKGYRHKVHGSLSFQLAKVNNYPEIVPKAMRELGADDNW